MALDTSGNEKVDFVWGNMAIQPWNRSGSGAAVEVVAANADQNKGWSGYSVYPSGDLQRQQTITLNNGIVQENLDADSHDVATWLWSDYPGFVPNVGYQD